MKFYVKTTTTEIRIVECNARDAQEALEVASDQDGRSESATVHTEIYSDDMLTKNGVVDLNSWSKP